MSTRLAKLLRYICEAKIYQIAQIKKCETCRNTAGGVAYLVFLSHSHRDPAGPTPPQTSATSGFGHVSKSKSIIQPGFRRRLVGFHLQPLPPPADHMTLCCSLTGRRCFQATCPNVPSPDLMRETPERVSSSFRHLSASRFIFLFIPAVM